MKTAAFLSILSALATALLLTSSASANVAPEPIEMHMHLAHEDVSCEIKGDEAVVTGTFIFDQQPTGFNTPVLYLPVYAKEGTPVNEMLPEFTINGLELKVHFVKKEWENNRRIKRFGEMPGIEGQRVYWFYVPDLPQFPVTSAEDKPRQTTLKIRYTQKLAGNRFIYTPLIPNQIDGKDYGSISVFADRPLTLLDADKHSFVKEGDRFVVDPAHKRAIVVEVAKVKPQLP